MKKLNLIGITMTSIAAMVAAPATSQDTPQQDPAEQAANSAAAEQPESPAPRRIVFGTAAHTDAPDCQRSGDEQGLPIAPVGDRETDDSQAPEQACQPRFRTDRANLNQDQNGSEAAPVIHQQECEQTENGQRCTFSAGNSEAEIERSRELLDAAMDDD